MSILYYIYVRAVQALFLFVFFNRFIQGGPLVKPDRELSLMFLRDVLLDVSEKKCILTKDK